MKPIVITKVNFEEEVLKSSIPVLIDFYADWCGPCRMLAPVIDKLAQEVTHVKICKVNVDNENELASKFGVMSIPTIVAFKEGKVYNKAVGLQTKDKLLKMLD